MGVVESLNWLLIIRVFRGDYNVGGEVAGSDEAEDSLSEGMLLCNVDE